MRTIAVIDPYWTGHHPTYAKLFSGALLTLGHRVMTFCPEPEEVKAWLAAHGSHDLERFHGFQLHEPAPSRFPYEPLQATLTGIGMWRSAARAISKAERATGIRPDLVFFLWLDSYLGFFRNRHIVDRLLPHDWIGIYFQPRHLRQYEHLSDTVGPPTDHDVELLSRRCRGVALLDEGVAGLLHTHRRAD